ncbi:hypothetical protein HELRODRAFT_109653 [Helobdella robusta]|uniref:C2H2-type domain-containing protein n=1 Tax=Helobdella robusta TaxID=6412 RepID=T1EEV6_HELRO|nr:hypothetical protein HELRODRAFT_109653 [Helobdella robusta]ESO09424.1 hypothetical protein HELRODRAFT_109653 [Helobdella robusta]
MFYDIYCDDTYNDINYNSNTWSNSIGSDNFDSYANNFNDNSKIVENTISSDVTTETYDTLIRKENSPLPTYSSLNCVLLPSNDANETQSKPVKRQTNFVCHDCGEVLSTCYKLQAHQLKEHHKGKLFICKHCMFRSPRKKDLQAHCLSQHGDQPTGVKIYVCSCCQYKCIDKYRFEEHEAMHLGIQKFKCSLCDKAYTTRRGLKTHLKYHSANKPFKCTMCTAEFKVKSKLSDHMKLIHLEKGFKPYKCGYCDHFTAIRGNCNQHIKKNHPGLPIKVIDTVPGRKKTTVNYDYANLEGSDIDELEEISSNIKKSNH